MASVEDVRVRRATTTDVAALSQLRYRWRVGERCERGLDERAFEEALSGWIEDHAATHLPFLAEKGLRPVGMAWLALVDRIPGPEQLVRRSAYLQSVYVVADERGHGVGARLIQLVVDHGRSLGLDYIAVHPSEQSFPLYRRLGFAETSRVLELRDVARPG